MTKRKPKFNVFKDVNGEWRFNLEATNGRIQLQSESYKRRGRAISGIQSIIKNCKTAEILIRR
jgi:uncharacterized protein YegP (UPF0339 family)